MPQPQQQVIMPQRLEHVFLRSLFFLSIQYNAEHLLIMQHVY